MLQNIQTTRKPIPNFECIIRFSETSENVKIDPLVPHTSCSPLHTRNSDFIQG